eukprot:1186834-Prorocentrum_minimum.AAC.9
MECEFPQCRWLAGLVRCSHLHVPNHAGGVRVPLHNLVDDHHRVVGVVSPLVQEAADGLRALHAHGVHAWRARQARDWMSQRVRREDV